MAGAKQLLELNWFNKDKALIPSQEGRYAYEWVDPKDPRYCETRALVVDEAVTGKQSPKEEGTQYSERADLAPTEDNLLILGESGDVLEALTRVPELREKYLGKVKCIYIDPPFNTAQTFANYEDNLEHSVWLTMMRDRLIHLRKLLSDDGSIWVHLDDVENHRMRVLLDEVFGVGNFFSELSVELNPAGRRLGEGFATSHDTVLVYVKNLAQSDVRTGSAELVSEADFPLRTAEGVPYRLGTLRNHNKAFNPSTRPNLSYPFYADPGTGQLSVESFDGAVPVYPIFGDNTPAVWRWGREKAERQLSDLVLREVKREGKSGFDIAQKDYFSLDRTKKYKSVWQDVGTSNTAKGELKSLFPDTTAFATPKPERLLERIVHIATNPGDIVLDVFAGSGTTAAVAQKMGRRWVTCELVEDTFNRFTRPRLEKVINGEDQGGITIQKQERVDATEEGLPDGLSPEDAQKFNSALNKVLAANPELKTESVVKALKSATKTKNQKGVVNWRGGGGFTVAHLAPQCFDYVPELGLVTLTEAATGATLVNSVAANLNFSLTPDNRHFDGKRGSMFLKVVEGRLDKDKAEELLAHLNEGEGVTLAATELEPGIRQFARTTDKPCQIVHIPNDIFTYSATQEGK